MIHRIFSKNGSSGASTRCLRDGTEYVGSDGGRCQAQ
jgi:hypothetical protein